LADWKLKQGGCEIHQARGDTDVLLVQTALTSAAKQETILVGDNTEYRSAGAYHLSCSRHNVFCRPRTR